MTTGLLMKTTGTMAADRVTELATGEQLIELMKEYLMIGQLINEQLVTRWLMMGQLVSG